MNENTTNTSTDDDDYGFVDLGFAIDVLSFSFSIFGFSLFNYVQLQGSFCLFEVCLRDDSRSLLAFNPRPFPVETGTFYMFDTEHVSVDLLFMRFLIKKPTRKK